MQSIHVAYCIDNHWTSDAFAPSRATNTVGDCYITRFNGAYDCDGSLDNVVTDADKLNIKYELAQYT